MKKTFVGLCSLVMLLIVGVVDADSGNAVASKREAHAREADLEAHRKATREAIRRAVRGDQASPKTVHEKTYQSIHHEQVGQYIGSWVRLETYYGRKIEGTLKRVQGDIIYVDEHVAQGSASYPINKTKISGLKVLK